MMTPEQLDRVTTGYQNTTTGRRIAPVAHWSDLAFQRACGLPAFKAAPTAPQRMPML